MGGIAPCPNGRNSPAVRFEIPSLGKHENISKMPRTPPDSCSAPFFHHESLTFVFLAREKMGENKYFLREKKDGISEISQKKTRLHFSQSQYGRQCHQKWTLTYVLVVSLDRGKHDFKRFIVLEIWRVGGITPSSLNYEVCASALVYFYSNNKWNKVSQYSLLRNAHSVHAFSCSMFCNIVSDWSVQLAVQAFQ